MMRRRALMPIVGLVALAVLSLVAVARLAGPDDQGHGETRAQEATPTPAPTDQSTVADVTDGLSFEDVNVATYEVFLARDPFEPVVPVTADLDQGGAQPPGSTPMTSPTVVPTTSPTDGTDPSDPSAPGEPGEPGGNGGATDPDGEAPDCTTGKAVVCDGHVVELVDVFGDTDPTAVVRVDDTVYEVQVGDRFADNFEVGSIESSCATLLYGDDAFTLCEGDSILK